MNRRQQIVGVALDKVFNLALKEARFKQGVEYSFLGDQFVANGFADRLCQFFPMSRDHSLRPHGETKKLQRLVRVKQHPDRQPRRAKAVNSGNDDDRDADYEFESEWIDECDLGRRKLVSWGTVQMLDGAVRCVK